MGIIKLRSKAGNRHEISKRGSRVTRNNLIRKELGVQSIITRIEMHQLKWLGHLTSMCEIRLVKCKWETRIKQEKFRGRLKDTWNNEIV